MASQDAVGGLLHLVSDRSVEAAWRLDALLDLGRTEDPRVTRVLLGILSNTSEPRSLRLAVMRHLRHLRERADADVAEALRHVLRDQHISEFELRVQAALALGDCIDAENVVADLGAVCADQSEPFDLRYAAFISLERTGPTPACIAILRHLADDETLGPSARGILVSWRSA
jgi:HEAT repeat protein